MSGTGKSYWSKKLSKEYGFRRFGCDDLIEQRISKKVSSNNHNLRNWMGLPGTDKFAETQKTYMSLENQTMREILEQALAHPEEDVIIDTTGSIIYCETDILKKIKEQTKVVYLGNTKINFDEVTARFIKDPCPLVIWAGMYQPLPNETPEESLERCYRKLFESRLEHYENLYDFKIDFELHKSPTFTSEEFLKLISCDEILQHE